MVLTETKVPVSVGMFSYARFWGVLLILCAVSHKLILCVVAHKISICSCSMVWDCISVFLLFMYQDEIYRWFVEGVHLAFAISVFCPLFRSPFLGVF